MTAAVIALHARHLVDEDDSAEAGARAGILADWLAGNRLERLAAEYLARLIDASTPDGPRLIDEIHALARPTAA